MAKVSLTGKATKSNILFNYSRVQQAQNKTESFITLLLITKVDFPGAFSPHTMKEG